MLQQFVIIPPLFLLFYASSTVEKNRKTIIICVKWSCWNELHMERKLKTHALIVVKPCSTGQGGNIERDAECFPSFARNSFGPLLSSGCVFPSQLVCYIIMGIWSHYYCLYSFRITREGQMLVQGLCEIHFFHLPSSSEDSCSQPQ